MQADRGNQHSSAPPARPSLATRPMPSELAAQPRPRVIEISYWLGLGTCLIGMITAAATLRDFDQLRAGVSSIVAGQLPHETPATRDEVATATLASVIGAGVVVILIQMALVIAMHSGRGWARFALVGSTLLGALYNAAVFGTASMMAKAGLLAVNGLMVIAVVLMFFPAPRAWFKQRRVFRPNGYDDSE